MYMVMVLSEMREEGRGKREEGRGKRSVALCFFLLAAFAVKIFLLIEMRGKTWSRFSVEAKFVNWHGADRDERSGSASRIF